PISSVIDNLTFFTIPLDTESMEITFNASESNDPDNDVLTYLWDFADGSTGDGQIATHTYTRTGIPITVSLTVTDSEGASNTVEARILVSPTAVVP
ncbi:MAG: PKD domain-containing protein, partial [Deinococcota bacterium]